MDALVYAAQPRRDQREARHGSRLPRNGGFDFAVRRSARYRYRHLSRLIKIGASGDASIDKVAGPVGEALIMTAIGLVVAVPAVMGYNWLQRRNKLIAERMSVFCNDLHGYMMSNGAVRPAVKAAAPAAAAKPAAAKA